MPQGLYGKQPSCQKYPLGHYPVRPVLQNFSHLLPTFSTPMAPDFQLLPKIDLTTITIIQKSIPTTTQAQPVIKQPCTLTQHIGCGKTPIFRIWYSRFTCSAPYPCMAYLITNLLMYPAGTIPRFFPLFHGQVKNTVILLLFYTNHREGSI